MNDYYITNLSRFTLREYLELLKQLSPETYLDSDTNDAVAFNNFNMEGYKSTFIVLSKPCRKIIGAASVVFEPKFNRKSILKNTTAICGHIEDVIIDKDYRNRGVGKYLINYVLGVCKSKGCYKVILDCASENVEFYKKCGFEETNFTPHEICMRINL